jgi:hypothetical protein
MAACGPIADPEIVAKAVEATLEAEGSTGDTMATAVAATLGPPADTPPAPTETPAPSQAPMVSAFQAAGSTAWTSYASEESIEPFADFVLSFPTTWWLQVEKTLIPMGETAGPPDAIVNLELRNGEYTIQLGRPGLGWDAGGCLYPEDPPLEGMYARYGEYREFQKPGVIVWRRAEPEEMPPEGWAVAVCELHVDSGRFLGFTSIGFLSLHGPKADERALSEFDAILEALVVMK